MAFAPRGFLIKGPRLPESPCYGLFDVVQPQTINDPHWMASGVEWEDWLCGPSVSGFIDQCPPATGFTKDIDRDGNFCHADPFIVYGGFQCSPVGRPVNEAFEIARQRLLTWEQHEVERILWTGQSANGQVNPSFAFGNPDCDILPEIIQPGQSLSPTAALAVLEAALADVVPCGGVIHAPYGFASFLAADRLIERVGDKWYTTTGFPIIFGAGYPGTGPGGVLPTPGATWLFATGPLVVVRSNVIMTPEEAKDGINRNINNIEVRAERFYSVGFSCGLFAVEATLTCGCCSG